MNTATHLTQNNTLATPALVRPLGRHRASWLAAVRSSVRAKAIPAASTVSTSALDRGCTLWVDQPMARNISCMEGTLWLTFDGVRKDFILEAGQSYRCECASRLAIHALATARFNMA